MHRDVSSPQAKQEMRSGFLSFLDHGRSDFARYSEPSRFEASPLRPYARSGVLCAGFLLALLCGSKVMAAEPRRHAVATRVDGELVLDGRLDEAAWSNGNFEGVFVQRSPEDGAEPKLPTAFRVLYDDDTVYIGIHAYDTEPDAIEGYLTRRDLWSPSDWVLVYLGSEFDHRSAYVFYVNPAGVKRDARMVDDSVMDLDWDAVWEVETGVGDDGWVAEFAIPLSQLSFSGGEMTWDLQVERSVTRHHEGDLWAPIPRDSAGWVSNFGELRGMNSPAEGARLELLPYVMGVLELRDAVSGDPFQTGEDWNGTVGLDANYRLTSNLSLSMTFNPDFGQIEGDPAEINLSAFETFQSERRPFFLRGSNILTFNGPKFFYSRRIGRAPQYSPDFDGSVESVGQTPIFAAGRLSGKVGGWTVGVLDAVTDEVKAQTVANDGRQGEVLVEPLTNAVAARVEKELNGGDTSLGAMTTALNRGNMGELDDLRDQAYVGGLDFTHRWAEKLWLLKGYLAASHVRGSASAIQATQESSARYFQRTDADYLDVDPTRRSLTGFAGQLVLQRQGGEHWRGEVGAETYSPEFELNDVGYMQRADFISPWVWLGYRDMVPNDWLRYSELNLTVYTSHTYGLETTLVRPGLSTYVQFPNYWGAWAGFQYAFDADCVTCTRGGPTLIRPGNINTWVGFESDWEAWLAGSFDAWTWLQPETGGAAFGVTPRMQVRPTSFMDVELGPSFSYQYDDYAWTGEADGAYVFAELYQTTVDLTLRVNLTFTPDLTLQFYGRPFVSAGRYNGFKILGRGRADSYSERFESAQTLERRDSLITLARADAAPLVLDEQDYNSASFRSNLVFRWEWLPGSTAYLVYQHGRSSSGDRPELSLGNDLGGLFGDGSDNENLFMLKVSLWAAL